MMKKILLSTPRKAREHLHKVRGHMDKLVSGKMMHEEKKNQPKILSLVDHMNAKGLPSHWHARKQMADKYGIRNYAGTSAQNGRMLAIMQNGTESPSNPTK